MAVDVMQELAFKRYVDPDREREIRITGGDFVSSSGRDKSSAGSSGVMRMFFLLMLSQPSADLQEKKTLFQDEQLLQSKIIGSLNGLTSQDKQGTSTSHSKTLFTFLPSQLQACEN